MSGWIVLILHIIGCILIWFLIKAEKLKVSPAMMPVVVCVPVFGEISAAIIHVIVKADKDGKSLAYEGRRKAASKEDGAVELKPEEEQLVVPLEEALLLNENLVRRSLIMDILTGQPDEYLSVLNQARLNEDAEVVHYAVTAVTELTKQYDLRLQKLEAEYAEQPEEQEVLDRYITFLAEYIEKEIAQGQYLLIQRNQLIRILRKRLEMGSSKELYGLLADNEIELKRFSEAGEVLEQMEAYWPEDEEVWLLKLKYYAIQAQGDKIQELISLIDQKRIYLTADGEKTVDFWRHKAKNE